MRTDPPAATGTTVETKPVLGRAQQQRWLADLERALLAAWTKPEDAAQGGSAASGRASAAGLSDERADEPVAHAKPESRMKTSEVPASTRQVATESRGAASSLQQSFRAAGARSSSAKVSPRVTHDAAVASRLPSIAPAVPFQSGSTATAMQALQALADRSYAGSQGSVIGAEVPPLLAQPSEEPALAGPSLIAADRITSRNGVDVAQDAAKRVARFSQAAKAETTNQYPKRLVHVALCETAQATVRDADLDPSRQEAVAMALFEQVRSEGVTLERVYVNGRRFESKSTTSNASLVAHDAGDASRGPESGSLIQPTFQQE